MKNDLGTSQMIDIFSALEDRTYINLYYPYPRSTPIREKKEYGYKEGSRFVARVPVLPLQVMVHREFLNWPPYVLTDPFFHSQNIDVSDFFS